MKLKTVFIENFRCFKDSTQIDFCDLTTFIGKNDIGKSTVLEALEIFFNNDIVKIDQTDPCIYSDSNLVKITCIFNELPEKVILDSGAETSLTNEFLLDRNGDITIQKVFDCSKSKPSSEIYIIAQHPTKDGFNNLLELKEKELQKLVKEKGLDVALKGNPQMRSAIWDSCDDLQITTTHLLVNKAKEDYKRIWEQIESYLPIFALFQSDRSSQDSDSEVQNPMKAAIAEAISDANAEIERIQEKVKTKAIEIANQTHEALKEIDPKLASRITPQFTPPTTSKWNGLFSISMDTDEGISLNKRGSGVRRMILVSFFKAEAKRRMCSSNKKSVIYALEEPETAQHPNNQKVLIDSFNSISKQANCQVFLTTHSPGLAKELPIDSIRYISRDENNNPVINKGENILKDVCDALGVFVDKRVQALVCVEGPTDVVALKLLSSSLHNQNKEIINLDKDARVAIVPLGGSSLKHWVAQHYLKSLSCPEFHIYDNDVNTYQKSIDVINKRGDGSWGTLTKKYEMECYLHPDAIKDAYDIDIEVLDFPGENKKGVPTLFGEAYSTKKNLDGIMKDNTSKNYLSKAFQYMTPERINERDPEGEISSWFNKIKSVLK